jgi:hypothetical protein
VRLGGCPSQYELVSQVWGPVQVDRTNIAFNDHLKQGMKNNFHFNGKYM